MFKDAGKLKIIDIEHKYLDWWEKEDIFNKLRKQNKDGPRWSFLDGPITANNPMGVHHAWGRSYKDLFQRYNAMHGRKTRYQNGFDCQGLWVEVEVEKELGFKTKKDIEEYGIEKFVQKCKDRVKKYSKIQTEQSKRLGYWMDWDNSYYTMSDENNYTIWHFLKKCHEKGWVYRGSDVMPWCHRCGTALSEHEIVTEGYKELTHRSVFVKFKLKGRKNESLLVWTTTPWTLTSNTAAAVHPEMKYIKVKQGEEIHYLMESLKNILKGDYEILDTFTGEKMLGWEYHGPFDELPAQKDVVHKVIPWKEITESEGTGIVHIAPGCGKEDFALSKEYNLSVIAPLDENGQYVLGFDWLTGMHAEKVADKIFDSLKRKNILYKLEDYTHRYPVCWRCGRELVFRLVDEWFINMDELRHQIMDVTRQIRWMPEYGMDRELDWLKNMHDWCISKKRYWGLCLPIYNCHECGNFDVIGSREELKKRAVEGWEEFEGHSPHKPYIDKVKVKCSKCGEITSRIPDVGNPWLDAGIVPYSTLHYLTDHEYWKKWFPAEFITECFPGQFRNWFYSLLAMSTVMENKPPFLTILGHALVKDEKGDDMHKSAGNAIWFEDAAEKMGVDVMRYIFASHNPYNNLNFGFNLGHEILRKMLTYWNCYSFFVTYAAVDGFNPTEVELDKSKMQLIDKWLLSKLNSLMKKCNKRMENYEVAPVMRMLEEFIDDLSNWYIRTGRRRFWKSENDDDKTVAYLTLYNALVTLVKLYAPMLPFLSEEMYQNLVRSVDEKAPQSIHLCKYPQSKVDLIDQALEDEMQDVIDVVKLGRSARNASAIKIRQPLEKIVVAYKGSGERKLNEKLLDILKEELNVKGVEYTSPDSGDLMVYKVKPNLTLLGKRLRGDAPKVRTALEELSDNEIRETIIDRESFVIEANAKEYELTKDEILVETASPEHLAVVEDDNWIVALDTRLSEQLIKEGQVRELIHRIQDLRKEADYHVSDRIHVYYSSTGNLAEVMEEFADHIKSEVLALEMISFSGDSPDADFDIKKTIEFDEKSINIALKKIKSMETVEA